MVSPKRKPRAPSLHNGQSNWAKNALFGGFVVALILIGIKLISTRRRMREEPPEKIDTKIFIAIGSKPSNFELRDGARKSWLRWRREGEVEYKFFSDDPDSSGSSAAELSNELIGNLLFERSEIRDLVLMPLESGYGTKEDNMFLARALYQFQYAQDNYNFRYFLRIDDDSFLCLHRLVFEADSYPKKQFFMGRYWCKSGRHRADENFMMFSADVAEFFSPPSSLLPLDPKVTFAWNFGLLSQVLNLTIFDDQTRIDAQQKYLTDYMHHDNPTDEHSNDYKTFCTRFIYAHHVKSAQVMEKVYNETTTHLLYDAPNMMSKEGGCKIADQSFIPARHSKALPNIIIQSNTDDIGD
eukprot:Plantae.Rhodophyta-Purpureofilum_apyrenoidigerum.ctg4426.p1 GENE.Plantae.Rhodophyta-Purpureofilum_apyrenoidigerum.ctg4426~~Plantae.Rhodophyta-Purpureofilum_apyrenoidigerum.ctg4426.p1  ORF type:complete len:354 (+),score=60.92 Plantae.Rhodophyta-Purpureofilum_apyrenoidigerum.ctg4426:86-1147(+)